MRYSLKRLGLPVLGYSVASLMIFALIILSEVSLAENKSSNITPEGLVRIEGSRAEYVYLKPGVKLEIYNKFLILDTPVSFHEKWESNHQRYYSRKVPEAEMKRIKESTARIFKDVFVKQLKEGGYPIVSEPGRDVIILRPVIFNLYVAAVDSSSARGSNFTTASSSAALMLELYDSITGEILGRAYDVKAANKGFYTHSSRVSSNKDAIDIFSYWAKLLIQGLNEIHSEAGNRTK